MVVYSCCTRIDKRVCVWWRVQTWVWHGCTWGDQIFCWFLWKGSGLDVWVWDAYLFVCVEEFRLAAWFWSMFVCVEEFRLGCRGSTSLGVCLFWAEEYGCMDLRWLDFLSFSSSFFLWWRVLSWMDGFEVIRLFTGFCERVLAWMYGLETSCLFLWQRSGFGCMDLRGLDMSVYFCYNIRKWLLWTWCLQHCYHS